MSDSIAWQPHAKESGMGQESGVLLRLDRLGRHQVFGPETLLGASYRVAGRAMLP